MGVAAYHRASRCIAERLSQQYQLSFSARVELQARLYSSELRIVELEQFCRDAQSIFVDAKYEDTAKGLVRSNIRHFWLKKKDTKVVRLLEEECIASHVAWVNSNRIDTFTHLQACIRKAKAWSALLNKLNRSFELPFPVPRNI